MISAVTHGLPSLLMQFSILPILGLYQIREPC
jgi:hypothetical protein